jgi:hypothetical protein
MEQLEGNSIIRRCVISNMSKDRDGINNSPIVAEARKKLLNFESTSSFVVKMAPAGA